MKNFKVKVVIIISFCAVLVCTIILGVFSIIVSQNLSNGTISFYESAHSVQVEVLKVQMSMQKISNKIKDACLSKNISLTKETTAFINETLADMNNKIIYVHENFTGNKDILTKADADVTAWAQSITQLGEYMEQENYTKSEQYLYSTYVPFEQELFNSVQVVADEMSVLAEEIHQNAITNKAIAFWVVLAVIAFTVAVTLIIAFALAKLILKPLFQVKAAANEIAAGNLKHKLLYESKNEFGDLADSMRSTSKEMESYINNIKHVLGNISNNILTDEIDMEYAGDFSEIKSSLINILSSLRATVNQIEQSAQSVSQGAELVSDSAQTLSQGTSEQASSVEEIFANVNEISGQVQVNASTAKETNELVKHVGMELNSGNEQMVQMLSAMSDINTASDQIAKIIKTIEDIAFQTNILALNAAVEAARAGAAGKGFAVVADEVRNLAGKSAEAAKSTTELIQNAISAVEGGTKIANGTAQSLGNVVTGASKITVMVEQITDACAQQAVSLSEVSTALTQVSQVVQNNSASAEESAAASEELSTQAQLLKGLVQRFKMN